MTKIRLRLPGKTIQRTMSLLPKASALLVCLLLFPLAAHASPFDSGISSIQTLFTGTIAKAAALIAIVMAASASRSGNRARRRTSVAWRWAAGSLYWRPTSSLGSGVLNSSIHLHSSTTRERGADARHKQRRNIVSKSLHKRLTYMGIERKLFFFVVVAAVGCFDLFDSIIAGAVVSSAARPSSIG